MALAILVFPTAAHAWAPLAHLSFSARALLELESVPAPTRGLLGEYANEFLYGSLAADIVVGKNLTRYLYHCHNWRVGFNVHRAARPGGERAFALGFLAHLAADTVAHNYFVPYQAVGSFRHLHTRHAYWELRYDQRMDRTLSRVARVVSGRAYRGHDELLRRTLKKASVLPFSISRGLFGSLLASASEPRFQALSRGLLARPGRLPLQEDLVEETGRLSVEAILGVLREGERSEAARADATGARNLRVAMRLRRALSARRPRLAGELAAALSAEVRGAFRQSLSGPLRLPPPLVRLLA
ncbi:MAG TPA: zinc dependent phospholipase C family protein [Anaeromyxobacteraceae bacterium]|nr:zinc dependent phospholipase C family protein [Anaeromyxobacteraceae bacterium]